MKKILVGLLLLACCSLNDTNVNLTSAYASPSVTYTIVAVPISPTGVHLMVITP